MRGKTVVITGGTSGIGEVAAVALARIGARIVLIARDKIRADATVAEAWPAKVCTVLGVSSSLNPT